MAKITYTDKVTLNPQPSIADENKVTSEDMNEIKSVVNGLIVNSYSTDNEKTYGCDYVNGLFKSDTNHYEFPNGLVICWGEISSTSMSADAGMGGYSRTVQLPITYSTIPLAINGFRYGAGLAKTSIKSITTNSITLGSEVQTSGLNVPYIVIGYK